MLSITVEASLGQEGDMGHILITGGGGFLGQRLAARLTAADPGSVELVLWDHVRPSLPEEAAPASRVLVGDLLDPALRREAISTRLDAVIHLAAVVSAQAEEDFDLGMQVNFDGTRALLEACRALATRPRFVMTSSVAVFGAAKAICELLVNEYSRRGFVDGRVLRLPTVVVRPGRPNRAASSFASSMIREPLAGEEAVVPVEPNTPMWLMSPDRAVDALMHAVELDAKSLGDDRVISLPGLSVSVGEMASALGRAGGGEAAKRVSWQFDLPIATIVQSWPGDFEATRAKGLGFEADASMDEIIGQHMAETGKGGGR
jgi:nucleoside-diphosphate-sugar epimerase